jgi:hypothetical protein
MARGQPGGSLLPVPGGQSREMAEILLGYAERRGHGLHRLAFEARKHQTTQIHPRPAPLATVDQVPPHHDRDRPKATTPQITTKL